MLKVTLAFILLLHGTFHLIGFFKAFQFVRVEQIHRFIPKTEGIIWLLVFMLFCLTAFLVLLNKNWWWITAFPAIIISQVLIFIHWQDAKFGSLLNIIFILAAVFSYVSWNFYNYYKKEAESNLAKQVIQAPSILTEDDLKKLPEPVKKYLRFTGSVGKPKVSNFKILFKGQIRKDETSEWMPFNSEQYNFLETPTRLFFMKAKMKQLPVAGYHCYKNGDASMDIRLFSLVKVQYQDGDEMDMAETVTFFNDMCCMAPATLIDKRINWLEVDGNKIRASFTHNNITIYAWLYFNEIGELINFRSDDRYAADAGKKLPWSTPLKNYKELNGYKLAGYAEAIYTYPNKELCYGTFSLEDIQYNCNDFN